MTVEDLPTVNAVLNGTAAALLFAGWVSVKKRRLEQHKYLMSAAFIMSALFLCSYLYYHYNAPGLTRYEGEGVLRALYFAILITHTPLATVMVPFVIAALYFAFTKQFARHVKVVRWLWPVWMYVSVTGVVIYLMLYVFHPTG